MSGRVVDLRRGKRYRAHLSLGWLERVASNVDVREKLEAAGFVDVNVVGSGSDRWAFGTWPGEDMLGAEMPDEIVDVEEEV
jgi:hypothetical protein